MSTTARAAGLAVGAAWTAESDQASAYFGFSVGDGGGRERRRLRGRHRRRRTATTTARRTRAGPSCTTARPRALRPAPAWTAESDQAGAYFGNSVATAGDVNGDGYADVIVGRLRLRQRPDGRGAGLRVSRLGLGPCADRRLDGGERPGRRLLRLLRRDGGGRQRRRLRRRHRRGRHLRQRPEPTRGGPTSITARPRASRPRPPGRPRATRPAPSSASPSRRRGTSTATATPTSSWAAHYYDNGQTDEGRAFVYLGSAAGLGATPAWTAESDQAIAYFGFSVATAGDVNGDGYSRRHRRAPTVRQRPDGRGRAYVYLRLGRRACAPTAAWTAESDQAGAYFGFSVATAGDVNGDGYSRRHRRGRPLRQRPDRRGTGVRVSRLGLGPRGRPALDGGERPGRRLLRHLRGDGGGRQRRRLLRRHRRGLLYDNGQTDEGRAFVYHGNDGGGLERIPRQARADDAAPIALLGQSDSDVAFRLKVLGRTPLGRGNVRLQWEVKPAGTPFDGTGLVTGPATDTGTPGGGGSAISLSELVTGLTPSTLYHWRLRIVTDSPFFPRSPWLWLPYNGVTEADVRTCGTISGVGADGVVSGFELLATNAPNPFGLQTEIAYALPERGWIRLCMHDVSGRRVVALVDREQDAGHHAVRWDGCDARGTRSVAGVVPGRGSSSTAEWRVAGSCWRGSVGPRRRGPHRNLFLGGIHAPTRLRWQVSVVIGLAMIAGCCEVDCPDCPRGHRTRPRPPASPWSLPRVQRRRHFRWTRRVRRTSRMHRSRCRSAGTGRMTATGTWSIRPPRRPATSTRRRERKRSGWRSRTPGV